MNSSKRRDSSKVELHVRPVEIWVQATKTILCCCFFIKTRAQLCWLRHITQLKTKRDRDIITKKWQTRCHTTNFQTICSHQRPRRCGAKFLTCSHQTWHDGGKIRRGVSAISYGHPFENVFLATQKFYEQAIFQAKSCTKMSDFSSSSSSDDVWKSLSFQQGRVKRRSRKLFTDKFITLS